jgi:hypothetical protein
MVIIPHTPSDLKEDIGVAAAAPGVQADQVRPLEHEALAESLKAVGSSLARIVGVIADTPVAQTRAITNQLVILDAARLRWLTPRTADQEPAEPGLVLLPPNIAPGTGPSTTDDTLEVGLRTWLSADVSATDPDAPVS